jgi:hypothetical protein
MSNPEWTLVGVKGVYGFTPAEFIRIEGALQLSSFLAPDNLGGGNTEPHLLSEDSDRQHGKMVVVTKDEFPSQGLDISNQPQPQGSIIFNVDEEQNPSPRRPSTTRAWLKTSNPKPDHKAIAHMDQPIWRIQDRSAIHWAYRRPDSSSQEEWSPDRRARI